MRKELSPIGIQMHAESQGSNPSDFRRAYRKLMWFVRRFKNETGYEPEFVDVGGGIGLNYETGRLAISFAEYSEIIRELVQSLGWPDGARRPAVMLREDGGSSDLCYPRTALPDGKIIAE